VGHAAPNPEILMNRPKHQREKFGPRHLIYRHPLPVRLVHWVVVLCFALLLMSGLQIFNAHPALYWGAKSDFDRPVLALRAADSSTADNPKGVAVLFGHAFDTTGVLGVSSGADGELTERGFPSWLTIPSYQDLATGRRWHFFFAWVLVAAGLFYFAYSFFSRHVQRDLVPRPKELRHIGRSILDHMRLRFPRGEEARHYNVLQKLSYLLVLFVVFPVLVLAGLAMSPGIDAAVPLAWIFGGRQSARTIHFICAWIMVLFVLVHVVMVLLSGVWNNLRSMITGRYAIESEKAHESHAA
jgi:thiosulfate reductase cytochrome b subunit